MTAAPMVVASPRRTDSKRCNNIIHDDDSLYNMTGKSIKPIQWATRPFRSCDGCSGRRRIWLKMSSETMASIVKIVDM